LKARVPDPFAIGIGVIVSKVLTMIVAEDMSVYVADLFRVDLREGRSLWPFLTLDLVLTVLFEVCALWMTWYLSRSGQFRAPSIAAGLILLITIVWRWVLNDFGWPLWYEILVLLSVPLALYMLHWAARNHGHARA